MKRLLAHHDLEAMMTSLTPLLPLVSRKSCEAGTTVLAGLLGEALEAQEASSKRSDDLKQLQPKGLMELFTPEKGNGAAVKSLGQGKGQKEKQQHSFTAAASSATGAAAREKSSRRSAREPQEGANASETDPKSVGKGCLQGGFG
jgi:hypothetical protein